jgi:hypothetical protein
MFSFLGSRTVPVPQPQQLLTHIALTNSIFCNCLLLSLSMSQQLLLFCPEFYPVTTYCTKSNSELYYNRQSVGLGVRHPSGTHNQFFRYSLWLFLDSCGFVDVGHPLWWEVGSVVFSTYYWRSWKLIYDRQSVGQTVLVSGTHLGPVTNFSFLLEIFFRQLQVCYFVAPSLRRGWVCNLL